MIAANHNLLVSYKNRCKLEQQWRGKHKEICEIIVGMNKSE